MATVKGSYNGREVWRRHLLPDQSRCLVPKVCWQQPSGITSIRTLHLTLPYRGQSQGSLGRSKLQVQIAGHDWRKRKVSLASAGGHIYIFESGKIFWTAMSKFISWGWGAVKRIGTFYFSRQITIGRRHSASERSFQLGIWWRGYLQISYNDRGIKSLVIKTVLSPSDRFNRRCKTSIYRAAKWDEREKAVVKGR